jgi:hypothetical protein
MRRISAVDSDPEASVMGWSNAHTACDSAFKSKSPTPRSYSADIGERFSRLVAVVDFEE